MLSSQRTLVTVPAVGRCAVAALSVAAAILPAVARSDVLFAAVEGSNQIGEYTTSGATLNASLITGLSGPIRIAVLGRICL